MRPAPPGVVALPHYYSVFGRVPGGNNDDYCHLNFLSLSLYVSSTALSDSVASTAFLRHSSMCSLHLLFVSSSLGG